MKNSDDNEIIRELLPYVHPHEGVLRAQLHREDHKASEELRFIFSFACGKCDHKSTVGYQVSLTEQRANTETLLAQVADRLRAYCEEIRNKPCLDQNSLASFAQRVTEMLMMHGTMTETEMRESWEVWFPSQPFQFALAVARHLGFQVPGTNTYQLPADHPWRRSVPDSWK